MEGCLICGGPQVKSKNGPPAPPPFLPSGENFVIREHLWAIFILRRFLQLPKETCERLLLHTFGLNPGGWFTLCETCSKVGHSAFRISAQILSLERELEGLREETKERLRRSMEDEEEHDGIGSVGLCVRQEIRGYFREETLRPLTTGGEVDVTKVTEELAGDDYNPNLSSDGDTTAEEAVSDDREEEQVSRGSPTKKKRPKRGRSGTRTTRVPSSSRPGGPPNKKRPYQRKPRAEDKYKCDKCDFVAKYFEPFKRHLRKHQPKIKDHIVQIGNCPTNTSSTSFRCNICSQDFPLRNDAVHHVRESHGAQLGLKTFPCASCDRIFEDRNQLEKHVKGVHLKLKQFCCDVCGACYSKVADFEDHKAKHLNDGRSAFVCDICGAEMSNRRTLHDHRAKFHPSHHRHQGEDADVMKMEGQESLSVSVKCPQCDIKVLHNNALKLHLKAAHGDLYKFACDSCDASYMRSGSLATHKAAAHGEQVKCQHCDKMIKCSKYLGQHWTRFCRKYPGKINS